MLMFTPHLRDLQDDEEIKYARWQRELEDIDRKSGFEPKTKEVKLMLAIQAERAATLSLYLEKWLTELRIPNCTMSALITYMAKQEPDDVMTPQRRIDIIRSHPDDENAAVTSEATKSAKLFTDAFRIAFTSHRNPLKQIDLRRILLLDRSVESAMDAKPSVKEGANIQAGSEDELAEVTLGTYCVLGCQICFSHSCDHGEYDVKNWRRAFGLPHLAKDLRRSRLTNAMHLINGSGPSIECLRTCYRFSDSYDVDLDEKRPIWTEDDIAILAA